MNEQIIIINDLLSFVWCKAKLGTIPRIKLLQCVEDFYTTEEAMDALNTLLKAECNEYLPKDENISESYPFRSIFKLMDRVSNNEAFMFVCKDLNNVPSTDDIENNDLDKSCSSPDDGLYEEHTRIKSDVNKLISSLQDLKKLLGKSQNSTESAGGRKREAKRPQVETNAGPYGRKLPVQTDTNQKGNELNCWDHFKAEPESSDEEALEERNMLVFSRYQRLQTRGAVTPKKIKILHYDRSQPSTTNTETTGRAKRNPEGALREIHIASEKMEAETLSGKNSSHSNCSNQPIVIASSEVVDSSEDEEENAEREWFPCLECGLRFKSMNSLNIHRISHSETDFRCPLCSNRFSENQWLQHVDQCPGDGPASRKDLQCQMCRVLFADKKALGLHMGYHDESRLFECIMCKYRFSTQKALKSHFKSHTGDDTWATCPFCPYRNKRLKRVTDHIRCHTGDKPFQCPLCPHTTTTYPSLQTHQRLHANRQRLNCNKCDKVFIRKSKLLAHLNCHLDSEDKRFQCRICNKGYDCNFCMKFHQWRHTRLCLECPECDAKVKTTKDLRKHIADQHSDKLSHMCSRCSFAIIPNKAMTQEPRDSDNDL